LGGRVAVLDSERGSASKYASDFDFDTCDIEKFGPLDYVRSIQEAEAAGYDVLIVDSLSHAWMGKGGALELVDAAAARTRSKDSFGAWREVTPQHNAMVDAIVRAKCHVIVTLRTKTEYVVEKGDNGKNSVRKVGLQPVQRDGLEFEFDVVGDLDEAALSITKTRCKALHKAHIREPGEELGKTLKAWLTDGAAAAPLPAISAPVHAEALRVVRDVTPPPAADAPSEFERLTVAISEAQDAKQLLAVGKRVKAAYEKGVISDEERLQLSVAYGARQLELRKAGAQ
jgi:hypothetical protein